LEVCRTLPAAKCFKGGAGIEKNLTRGGEGKEGGRGPINHQRTKKGKGGTEAGQGKEKKMGKLRNNKTKRGGRKMKKGKEKSIKKKINRGGKTGGSSTENSKTAWGGVGRGGGSPVG